MQPSPKMALILQAAIRQTAEGRLGWEPDADDPSVFMTSLEDALLTIDSVDGDGLKPYRLSVIRDDDQRTVLDFIAQTTGADPWSPYSFPEMEDLWFAARRIALDIEPVLDSVLTQLGGCPYPADREPETSVGKGLDPWSSEES